MYNQENINIFKKNGFIFLKYIKYILKFFNWKYTTNSLNKFALFKYKRSYILEFKHQWNFIKNLQIKLNTSTILNIINIKLSFLQKMNYYINIYFSYIYYIIHYHKFTYNCNYIQILNSNFFIEEISNLKIKTENLRVKLQYNLKNRLNIIQKLIIKYEEKYFISVYSYSYKNIQRNTYHCLYNIYKLKNSTELYLLLLLKYATFQYSNHAQYFTIYLHLLFYDNIKTNKWMNRIVNLYPYITFNYNKILNLPLVLACLHKNTIQLDVKINILDINKNLMVIETSHSKDEYINKKNTHNYQLINKAKYLFNIKYKIYPNKYIGIYLLVNHAKSISYQILYLPDIYLSKFISQNYNRIGIGVNLYTPFRKQPIVSVEFFRNDRYKNIIYICTNFS
uniref:Uncharacterized protein n=1 Tax=Gracilaria gracilis TaxID=2777 RepID=A0A345U7R7_GRAGA|nr:hypothetical protein [Gracilaria gracilis]AXI96503.1 hypothetical protein [Gracilaria gracilis]